MNLKIIILFVAGAMIPGLQAQAQTYDTNGDFVQTFAGSGFSGYVDGTGVNTMFHNPGNMVADSSSNLFVWDSANYRIRKIGADGTVTTFVGGGNSGQSTGIGTNVGLSQVSAGGGLMTIDKNDTIWMGAWQSASGITLYKISSDAFVTNYFVSLPIGKTFSNPETVGVCVDSSGAVYLSRIYEGQIYKWTNGGAAMLFAGSGNSGNADGNGIFSSFGGPTALTCDQADNIYVWDSGHLIRRINQNRDVLTIAGKTAILNGDGIGTNATFTSVYQMVFDRFGNLYLACDSCVRKMDAQTNVTTMAGSFTESGYTNGVSGNLARFNGAHGVCLSQGMIFVADSLNQRIRNITFNPTPQTVSPANLQLGTYPGIQIVGTVGRTYQIQSSPDMGVWTTRGTILLNASPYLWIDQNAISSNQFYRAMLLP